MTCNLPLEPIFSQDFATFIAAIYWLSRENIVLETFYKYLKYFISIKSECSFQHGCSECSGTLTLLVIYQQAHILYIFHLNKNTKKNKTVDCYDFVPIRTANASLQPSLHASFRFLLRPSTLTRWETRDFSWKAVDIAEALDVTRPPRAIIDITLRSRRYLIVRT